jgi:hypothetical protein
MTLIGGRDVISRSRVEVAGLVLGAAVDCVWAGALAAALTGARGPALFLLAFAGVLAAALAARWSARRESRDVAGRVLAAVVVLMAVAAMLAAGRAWAQPAPLWLVMRDVAYAGGLVFLGIRLGRGPQSSEDALRRAAAGFVISCVIVMAASAGGPAPAWAAEALVASLALGGLYVAIVRYQSLTELVDPSERLPVWPWLLGVAGVFLLVIVGGALAGRAFATYLLPFILDLAVTVLGYLLRGLTWLLDLIQVRGLPTLAPKAIPSLPDPPRPHSVVVRDLSAVKAILTAVAAFAAVVFALALVVVASRRSRREPPAPIAEERETLTTLTVAAGDLAARLGRRLRRLAPRRWAARTPAERVRLRYAELEHRLSREGYPRSAGVTVRGYLEHVAGALPATGEAAGDLAAVYDRARYSGRAVPAEEAQRFETLARAFVATGAN